MFKTEFIDKENNVISDIDLPSIPYKVGDKIHLKTKNSAKGLWDIEDTVKTFEIIEIEYFINEIYGYSSVNKSAIVSITVVEINDGTQKKMDAKTFKKHSGLCGKSNAGNIIIKMKE